MPSEVYLRTRDALATLVSERAATRVLDAALRRASISAERLDEGAVRKLLLGPVQRELEGILPRAGLHRTLRRLARQVADSPRQAPEPSPVAAHSPSPSEAPSELHPVTRSSVYLPDVALPDDHDPDAPARDAPGAAAVDGGARATTSARKDAGAERLATAPERAGKAAVAARDGERRGYVPAAAPRPSATRRERAATAATEPIVVPKALPDEVLDRLAVRFAEIEGVTQVIGLRDRNEAPQVRGEGVDPDALAPLARSAIRLLGRHGPLRSLVLEHPGGLLFIFPLGRDAVAVLAATDVNMGAVFAARAALEEAQ